MKINIFLIIFFWLSLNMNFIYEAEQMTECPSRDRYLYKVKNATLFRGFNSFKELSSCNKTLHVNEKIIEFIPNGNIIIDDTFQLNKIFNKTAINNILSVVMVNF